MSTPETRYPSPVESERLSRIERELAILRVEVARLRGDGRQVAKRPTANPEMSPGPIPFGPALDDPPRLPTAVFRRTDQLPETPSEGSPVWQPLPGRSVEKLVGRYGTLVAGTLTSLIAVGTAMNWSIRLGLLSPLVRVVLGFLVAAAVAIVGLRLRARAREFGNILLAVALAIVHVVCWSAGPLLHVIPSPVGLAIAFFTSAVLAEFALRREEEVLCALGFGGAAIAPFVTSTDSGQVVGLAAYGAVVVALSASALGSRDWVIARRVSIATIILYLAAVTGGAAHASLPMIADRLGVLFPAVAMVLVTAFAHPVHRRLLVRVAGGASIAGGLMQSAMRGGDVASFVATIAAGVFAVGVLDLMRPTESERQEAEARSEDGLPETGPLIDALLIPLGFFAAAVCAAREIISTEASALAVVGAALLAWMSHRARGTREADMYATAAAVIALLSVPLFPGLTANGWIVGTTQVSLTLAAVALRLPRRAWIMGACGGLTAATSMVAHLMGDTVPFAHATFLTTSSALALIVALAWMAVRLIADRADFLPEEFLPVKDSGCRRQLGIALALGASFAAVMSIASSSAAAVTAVLAACMAYRARQEAEADLFAGVAAATALAVVPAMPGIGDAGIVIGTTIVSLGLAATALVIPRLPFVAGAMIGLAGASAWSLMRLVDRAPFESPPFFTAASALIAVATVGWIVGRAIMRHSAVVPHWVEDRRRMLLAAFGVGACVTAFLWGRQELLGAWSAMAATASTVVYYALVGTAAIWQGRRRRAASVRIIGLALTLIAAGKAISEVRFVSHVGVQVATFVAVSAFSIWIAYWYRREAEE